MFISDDVLTGAAHLSGSRESGLMPRSDLQKNKIHREEVR